MKELQEIREEANSIKIYNYNRMPPMTEEVFISRGEIRNESKHRATCLKNKLKRKNKNKRK